MIISDKYNYKPLKYKVKNGEKVILSRISKYKLLKSSTIYFYLNNLIRDMFKSIRKSYNYLQYLKDWKKYTLMRGDVSKQQINMKPMLNEKTKSTLFDPHYFYQDIWAFRRIIESKCDQHVDVGSKVYYVGFLTAITKVTFIDIRPLIANLENFSSKKGSILSMPFKDHSVSSLSCLHVAEHIGLGRYGDTLDPRGTKKAAIELSRILAPDGNLYFSVPIGKPRLVFNAHRIHSTEQMINYFSELELKELSGVDDKGNFRKYIKRDLLDSCEYGLGLFWFKYT